MKNILVPLDGSRASEAALPAALGVARAGGYAINLLAVWEVEERFPGLAGFREETLRQQGTEYLRRYLRGVAARVEDAGAVCETHVRAGHPAVEILSAVRDLDASLLALSTRGRRAIAGRRGSVADKVLRASTVPVLAVGPVAQIGKPALIIRRLLVPLDGGAASEGSLPLSLELASGLGAEIHLLSVVPRSFDHYGPDVPEDYLSDLDRRARDDMAAYLCRLQSEHPDAITETHLLCGVPQEEIAAFLERSLYDLVVMASRSRYSRELWSVGGVADVLIEGPRPVIIVPPAAE